MVVAGAPVELVVSIAAGEVVVSRAAGEQVITIAAGDVVSRAAGEQVITIAAGEVVVGVTEAGAGGRAEEATVEICHKPLTSVRRPRGFGGDRVSR